MDVANELQKFHENWSYVCVLKLLLYSLPWIFYDFDDSSEDIIQPNPTLTFYNAFNIFRPYVRIHLEYFSLILFSLTVKLSLKASILHIKTVLRFMVLSDAISESAFNMITLSPITFMVRRESFTYTAACTMSQFLNIKFHGP